MNQLTNSILMMFSIMVISFFVKQRKKMPENTIPVLTALMVNVTMPALIFSSVANGTEIGILQEGIVIIGVAVVYYSTISLTTMLLLKNVPKSNSSARVFAFSILYANTAFMGLPLIHMVYGDTGVVLGALFDQVQTFLMFTAGIILLGGRDGSIGQTIYKRMQEPPVVALILGLLILILGIQLPFFVIEPIKMLGSTTPALAMFAIGQFIELGYFKDFKRLKKLVPLVALRLILLPLVVVGLISLLPLPLTAQGKGVIAIMVACPTAVLAAILAQNYEQDYEFAVMAVVATTGLSILTLPLILSLIMG